MAARKTKRKQWTAAERKAFAAKMKKARAAAAARRGGKPRKRRARKTTAKKAGAKKTARRTAKKTARRVAKKTARRTAKKTAKKTARRTAKKTAKRVAKTTARRVARRLTGAALKKHEAKLRREAYSKLGRSGPRTRAPVVITAPPGSLESLKQGLSARRKIAMQAKAMADAYAKATRRPKSKTAREQVVTAKDIMQGKPPKRAVVNVPQAIQGKRAPVKLKTKRPPLLGPRKFTALVAKPKVWACAGARRTGCGGGKKGGHVVGILR